MLVAALYDIHGNLPALEAVLDDVRRAGVEQIVVGGDVVPGPMPRETLDLLLQLDLPVRFIRGNGDRVVVGQMRGQEPIEVPEQFREDIRWNALQLTPAHEQVLASWPPTTELEIDGIGKVLFCHASLRNDTDIFTRETAEERLKSLFAEAAAPIVVCGHTHMQVDRTTGSLRIINAGSVGMPYGDPGAYWLLLGSKPQLRRTDYDLEAAARRVRATQYPNAEAFAATSILSPLPETKILTLFNRAAS